MSASNKTPSLLDDPKKFAAKVGAVYVSGMNALARNMITNELLGLMDLEITLQQAMQMKVSELAVRVSLLLTRGLGCFGDRRA